MDCVISENEGGRYYVRVRSPADLIFQILGLKNRANFRFKLRVALYQIISLLSEQSCNVVKLANAQKLWLEQVSYKTLR